MNLKEACAASKWGGVTRHDLCGINVAPYFYIELDGTWRLIVNSPEGVPINFYGDYPRLFADDDLWRPAPGDGPPEWAKDLPVFRNAAQSEPDELLDMLKDAHPAICDPSILGKNPPHPWMCKHEGTSMYCRHCGLRKDLWEQTPNETRPAPPDDPYAPTHGIGWALARPDGEEWTFDGVQRFRNKPGGDLEQWNFGMLGWFVTDVISPSLARARTFRRYRPSPSIEDKARWRDECERFFIDYAKGCHTGELGLVGRALAILRGEGGK